LFKKKILDFINHNFYLFFLEENIGEIQLLKTKYNSLYYYCYYYYEIFMIIRPKKIIFKFRKT